MKLYIAPWNIEWWKYVLEKPARGTPLWRAVICRIKGHPCGTIYYNPGGMEPDNRCKNCYDDLG